MTEEGDEVYRLLADWWMNTIQALVDAAGHEKALEFLRPYHRNASTAAALILVKELGVSNDFYSTGFVSKVASHFLHRSDDFECLVHENGSTSVISDCPFRYGPTELCDMQCGFGAREFVQTIDRNCELMLVARLSDGDTVCRWIAWPNGKDMPETAQDLGEPIAMSAKWTFPKEMIDSFSIQYLAEFWVIATRALVDQAGSRAALNIIRPYMVHSGISHGLRYRNSAGIVDEGGLDLITGCICACGRALQMRWDQSKLSDDVSQSTVTDCPFKETSPDVCLQFESFCQGVCEAIDPDYTFAYDRMMTRGDGTCHWTIRRKEPPTCPGGTTQATDPATELLRKRFVMGEISEQEYLQKRRVLDSS